jgi:hypothetical protein
VTSVGIVLYAGTYVHFGRNAESRIAPETPRPFLLKFASIMEVPMVIDSRLLSPLKVNAAIALLPEGVSANVRRA